MTYFSGFPFLVSFLLTQTLLFPTFFPLFFFLHENKCFSIIALQEEKQVNAPLFLYYYFFFLYTFGFAVVILPRIFKVENTPFLYSRFSFVVVVDALVPLYSSLSFQHTVSLACLFLSLRGEAVNLCVIKTNKQQQQKRTQR